MYIHVIVYGHIHTVVLPQDIIQQDHEYQNLGPLEIGCASLFSPADLLPPL